MLLIRLVEDLVALFRTPMTRPNATACKSRNRCDVSPCRCLWNMVAVCCLRHCLAPFLTKLYPFQSRQKEKPERFLHLANNCPSPSLFCCRSVNALVIDAFRAALRTDTRPTTTGYWSVRHLVARWGVLDVVSVGRASHSLSPLSRKALISSSVQTMQWPGPPHCEGSTCLPSSSMVVPGIW